MNERIIQQKRALHTVLIVLLLSVMGTMNAFALERGLPTVITTAVTKSGNDVVSGGNVVNDGGSPIIARGICYGNYPYPDLSSTFIHTENGTGSGSYTSIIDTTANGLVYVRAYATNTYGTAYGEQVSVDIDYLRLSRFVFNGNTYVVAPDPQAYNENMIMTTAEAYCNNLTAYGYSDWRMPNFDELEMMYVNRTSIGGFLDHQGIYYIMYHSCSYTSYGYPKIKWWNGETYYNDGPVNVSNTEIWYCHVRPIRVEVELPTVTTNSVTNIHSTYATCGGNVTSSGGASVTERGICWNTSPNPTIFNSHISSNYGGTGSYTLNMTGLIPGTQYYVRAYATNSEGTAYGDEVSFITNSPPTVTTNTVTNITPNSATCGGNVTAEGSGAVTARGVCWSTSPNPTTSNSHTNNGTGMGSFTSTLTGLNQGTLYYVRAYATNSEGTAYGEEVSFSTICTHSVTTNNVSYITQTSATCGGYVTVYYSGTTVTERGVCWSTSNQSPTLTDNHTSSGSGSGNFTSNLTGLTQNTTYYVRAYATSSEGTVYGQTKQFTTTKFEYRISEGGVVATSAGGYFYDSGGPDEEYGNNEQYIMTFKPNMGAGTKIKMTFTEYYTEYWGDYLVIYDGMNTSAPMIGTYGDGNGNSPGTITATNSEGALTFVWISDEWNTDPGWKAAISIVGQSYSYTINTSASPSYGGTVSGGGYYNGGESCTVTAQANDGYVFTNWIENGNVVSTNASYTFTVNSNRSLVANFQAQPQSFTINVSAYPTNGGTAAGGGTYNQGASCTVTATANVGYTFTNWTENGNVVSTQANYTFQVNNNRSLVANFIEVGGDNCNIVFDLMDSYGDGWNGNKLNVAFSDGSPSQEITFTSGYNASFVIGVNDGVYVTLSWTQGSYISECSFRVRYEIGPQIYYGSNLNSSFTYSFPMDCSSSNNTITFIDNNVKALCVANWDTSGNGELSYAEAAAVTNLGQVFQNNTNVTYFNELQYFVGLTSIGSNTFYGCSALASVSIPNSVTYFGGNAFTNCSSLTSITLPNSLTSIGNNAFFGCTGLTSIIIPSSVASLGSEVFRDCPSLAQMSVRSGNPVYDSRSYCNAIIKTATNELVYGCKNTVIPNSVTSIGGACDGCTSLASIEIPSSVTSIGNYAFYNCTSLTTMTVLADTPPTLGSSVFTNVIKSIPVYVPCGSMEAYQSGTSWSEFTNYQGIGCSNLQVQAKYYPDANNPYSSSVRVYWGAAPSIGPFDDFETGDFSKFDWQFDNNYPWSLTTINPYEGMYCMKSGGAGVDNVVSNMTVMVDIPADGIMSFFGKISCEASWDYGYFFIDGVQKGVFTGCNSSWTEKTYDITAGTHTFQWRYTKDASVNSCDDCFYVDYITFYKQPDPVQPGWHTYCESEFDNAYGSNVGTPCWAYKYPVDLLYRYTGFTLTKVSVFSDSMYCAVGGNYTCTIYSGGNEPGTGVAVSIITVDVPQNQNAWIDYDLTTPVTVTGTEPLWVVWTANTHLSNYPAGCSTGFNEYGNWWNPGDGSGWTHQNNCIWSMRNYFTNNRNNTVELNLVDSSLDDVENSFGNDRTYEYFRVYRAQCDGSGTMLIADNVAQPYYLDVAWLELNPGIYKYGVYSLEGNSTDIAWSNCIEKLASYQIATICSPSNGGTVSGDGTYMQSQSCILTATANSGYTFVNWTENGTVVSTNASYSFTVNGNRNLVANFEEQGQITNHWTPESTAYSEIMAMYTVIQIDGVEQYSNMLEVGVFCGDECRGSAIASEFDLTHRYLAIMNVFGENGHQLTFKLYDHSIGQELNLTSPATVTFDVNGYGTPVEPYVLNFTSTITHSQALNSGWNWWSTYIEQNGIDGLGMLENSIGSAGVRIQGRNGTIDQFEYQGSNYWYGSLTSIENEQMYKIRTNAACNAVMVGNMALPANHPITINGGWNWIGFPCNQSVSVNDAMSGFTPVANDVITGRNGSTTYVSYGSTSLWYGTLNTLEPGQGYMYKSNSNTSKTLVFQMGRGEETVTNATEENSFFTPNTDDFSDNMLVTAVIDMDGQELRSEDYEVAAYVGNECRGSVRLMYVEPFDRYVAFLLVFGEAEEEIHFVLTDGNDVSWSDDFLTYTAVGLVGTLTEPATLHFGTLGLNDNEHDFVNVFPNPSNGVFNIEGYGIHKIEVVNAFGQTIFRKETEGSHVQIDLSNKAAGMYLLRVITNNGVITNQLIKVK